MTIIKNLDLGLAVADHVERYPDLHNQELWGDALPAIKPEDIAKATNDGELCGTAGCIAGWIMAFSGYKLKHSTDGSTLVQRPDSLAWHDWEDEDFIRTAAGLLGMNLEEAKELFYEMDNQTATIHLRTLLEQEVELRRIAADE